LAFRCLEWAFDVENAIEITHLNRHFDPRMISVLVLFVLVESEPRQLLPISGNYEIETPCICSVKPEWTKTERSQIFHRHLAFPIGFRHLPKNDKDNHKLNNKPRHKSRHEIVHDSYFPQEGHFSLTSLHPQPSQKQEVHSTFWTQW